MAVVKVTRKMAEEAVREIDWAKQDALTDEDIARAVADDPDAAPIRTDAELAADLVHMVRRRLGISQAEFAARFQVPIGTLRDCEQGRKRPDSPALAYLRVIAREPEIVAKALRRRPAA